MLPFNILCRSNTNYLILQQQQQYTSVCSLSYTSSLKTASANGPELKLISNTPVSSRNGKIHERSSIIGKVSPVLSRVFPFGMSVLEIEIEIDFVVECHVSTFWILGFKNSNFLNHNLGRKKTCKKIKKKKFII